MNYSTLDQAVDQAQLPVEIEAMSVYRAFEQVQDGRHRRGVRYDVALILTLILLGKLAGMTNPAAIAEWVRLRAGWLRQVLPVSREEFPCASTYSNGLRTLNAEQVNQVLAQVLTRVAATQCCGDDPGRLPEQAEREAHVPVALDGKTLRGTLGHEAPDQKKMHQLGLYETQTGVLLKEQVVGDKQNETPHRLRVPDAMVGQGTHHLGGCLAYPGELLHQRARWGWLLPAHGQRQSVHLS